jgi:hypothetical protein
MNRFTPALLSSAVLALALALALAPSLAEAAPLTVVEVGAPAINCVFNTTCTVVVSDTVGDITLPGVTGTGRLQSRTFDGKAGAPAAGAHGYDYRIDLTSMQTTPTQTCVGALKVTFGPVETYDYQPNMPAQVYVVTSGGLGSVGPTSARKEGPVVIFEFKTPVCPGQTSYFFGLASKNRPDSGTATIHVAKSGTTLSVPDRAPKH